MTEPPPRVNFSATANQVGVFCSTLVTVEQLCKGKSRLGF